MGRAKEITMKVIPSSIANPFIKAHHYSGKVVNNSKLHFGVFLDGQLHGVMSYGPSLDKSKIIGLVEGTGWNEFLELNRMAFDSVLPRNSESRAISMSIKLLKKYAPQVKWIISFADACSCGDGTIYRASNFVLTGIKENLNLAELPDGTRVHKMTLASNPTTPRRADILRRDRRHLQFQEISGLCGCEAHSRFPTAVYVLHRPEMPQTADRAGNPIFQNR